MPAANECLKELSFVDLDALIIFLAPLSVLGLGQECEQI